MDNDLLSASENTQTRPAYSPSKPKPPKKRSKAPYVIIATLLLLALAGFAIWKFVIDKPKTDNTPIATPTTTIPKTVSDTPDEQITEKYTSSKLSVAFKYPSSWRVSEATGGIRIESPNFTYNGQGAGDIKGNFRIYVRQGARAVDSKFIGRGVAVKSSDKLTYTQPAIGQRTDTLLSTFGLDTSENFGFFLIAANFDLVKNDTLGPSYGQEPDTYIVAGGYSTPAAVDDLAFTAVNLNYYSTTNAYKQAMVIISSLQLK